MLCKKCAKETPDHAIFCPSCWEARKSISASGSNPPWSICKMTLVIIGTFMFPLIGVIFGIDGVLNKSTRIQGVITIVVAILAMWLWMVMINVMI